MRMNTHVVFYFRLHCYWRHPDCHLMLPWRQLDHMTSDLLPAKHFPVVESVVKSPCPVDYKGVCVCMGTCAHGCSMHVLCMCMYCAHTCMTSLCRPLANKLNPHYWHHLCPTLLLPQPPIPTLLLWKGRGCSQQLIPLWSKHKNNKLIVSISNHIVWHCMLCACDDN